MSMTNSAAPMTIAKATRAKPVKERIVFIVLRLLDLNQRA